MSKAREIKSWLNRIDALIEQKITDPSLVKNDPLLREAFVLAHPPRGSFPTRILVEGPGEIEDYAMKLAAEHSPYYEAGVTRTTGTDKRGRKLNKIKLELKLTRPEPYRKILKQQGLL